MGVCETCDGHRLVAETCSGCSGSGEGPADGTTCMFCKGKGVEVNPCPDCTSTEEKED